MDGGMAGAITVLGGSDAKSVSQRPCFKKTRSSRLNELLSVQVGRLLDPDRTVHIAAARDIHVAITRSSTWRRLKAKSDGALLRVAELKKNGNLTCSESDMHRALMGAADAVLYGKAGRVLERIEDFLLDERAIISLGQIGSTRGLEKVALYHDEKDGVPAAYALCSMGEMCRLECVARSQENPVICIAAVEGIRKLSRHEGTDALGDDVSSGVYKLKHLSLDSNSNVARLFSFVSIASLSAREDALGKVAKEALRWIGTMDEEYQDRAVVELGSLVEDDGTPQLVRSAALMAISSLSLREDDLGKKAGRLLEKPDEGGMVVRETREKLSVREAPDGTYESSAWQVWTSNGTLDKLIRDIEEISQAL